MKTYISILRGINVGGHRKILMADLKAMYSKMGFQNISSYIQSGNVIFQYSGELETKELEEILEEAIKENFGHEVPVIVREQHEWEKVIRDNPFLKIQDEDIAHLHCAFLADIPQLNQLDKLLARETENDQIKIIGKQAYILCRGPLHKTPLSHQLIEKTLQTKATIRNWKGVLKLSELANS